MAIRETIKTNYHSQETIHIKGIWTNDSLPYVIHIQTKGEFEEFVSTVKELNCESLNTDSFRKLTEKIIKNKNYDGCWCICSKKGISYNPSIEYWKSLGYIVLENINGKTTIHLSYENKEAALIESRKLLLLDDEKIYHKFGIIKDQMDEELVAWLISK